MTRIGGIGRLGAAAGALLALLLAACATPAPRAELDREIEGPTRCANHPANDRYERNRRLQAASDTLIAGLRTHPDFADLTAPCFGWAPESELARMVGERPRDPPLGAVAAYHCAIRTLILLETQADALDDPLLLSYILRELVHHGQCRRPGVMLRDRCEREEQSYRIQAEYLRGRAVALTGESRERLLFFANQRLADNAAFFCRGRRPA